MTRGLPAMPTFRLQHLMWGYALHGGFDPVAAVCEDPSWGDRNGWWDRTRDDFRDTELRRGDEVIPVPDWWALACSGDLAMAGMDPDGTKW